MQTHYGYLFKNIITSGSRENYPFQPEASQARGPQERGDRPRGHHTRGTCPPGREEKLEKLLRENLFSTRVAQTLDI